MSKIYKSVDSLIGNTPLLEAVNTEKAENLNAKGRLATSQSELKDVEAGIRRQEAANLPIKQQQEAEVRKARARQAWAAALRQRNKKPKKKTLKRRF